MDFRQKADLLSRMDFINVFLFPLRRLEEWSNYLQGIASGSIICQAWSFKSAANTRQALINGKKKKKRWQNDPPQLLLQFIWLRRFAINASSAHLIHRYLCSTNAMGNISYFDIDLRNSIVLQVYYSFTHTVIVLLTYRYCHGVISVQHHLNDLWVSCFCLCVHTIQR